MTLNRRSFISGCLGLGGGAVAGALLKKERLPARRLRPPGASVEKEFLAACIRCGQCVKACPNQTLLLSGTPAGWGLGAPYFLPEQVPCNLCAGFDSLQCIDACPTQALKPIEDYRQIRIGKARIDESLCLAYNQVICRACWHACPYPNEAIAFDKRLRPVVNEAACIGCGLCTHACPTEPRAIPIVPEGA